MIVTVEVRDAKAFPATQPAKYSSMKAASYNAEVVWILEGLSSLLKRADGRVNVVATPT